MIAPDSWVPACQLELEPNALIAVKASMKSTIVGAGPGAGKTELLAQRADFLFRTGIAPYPRRILAIAFKVDAARNLRERVRRRSGGQYAARFDSFTFHAFAKRLIDNYRLTLTGQDALNPDYRIDRYSHVPHEQITFDDMVPLALKILENNPYALGGIRQTYSHVFFDEFQDATKGQYELIKSAFGESSALLTAVGDPKQRIMGFAGALEGIMQTFADDFDAQPLALYQNRRSAPRLRRMQNRMVLDMDPSAASDPATLTGEQGEVEVLSFPCDDEEAEHVAALVHEQLEADVPASEIAILIRYWPHLIGAKLFERLAELGVPVRNEQADQDLAAEPAPALILNFIQVVADDMQPAAYTELMRAASRPDSSEEEASRFDRRLKKLLQDTRSELHGSPHLRTEVDFWQARVAELLELVTRPVLLALSPTYAQGSRLDDLIQQTLDSFEQALIATSDPAVAVRSLSDIDAVRVLTIHKCKGLEFDHVIVVGIEHETFFAAPEAMATEYFVSISRAKTRLTLTHCEQRERPIGHSGRWSTVRTPQQQYLDYAVDQ